MCTNLLFLLKYSLFQFVCTTYFIPVNIMNIISHVICSPGEANSITVRVSQVTKVCDGARYKKIVMLRLGKEEYMLCLKVLKLDLTKMLYWRKSIKKFSAGVVQSLI